MNAGSPIAEATLASHGEGERGSTRSRLCAIAGWFLLAFVYLYWGASPVLGGFGGDNAQYLLLADRYSPYTQPSPLVRELTQGIGYPLLYPVLLAIFGGAGNMLCAHLITVSFLILSFAVFHRWLRSVGLGPIQAAVLTAALASVRGIYIEALEIHTEYLYLLLSLAALTFAERADREGLARWWWAAALSVGAATVVRSAGLALLGAFLLYLLLRRPRGFLGIGVVSAIPQLWWTLVGGNGGQLSAFFERYGSIPPGAFLDRILVQANWVSGDWVVLFTPRQLVPVIVVLAILALVCVLGVATRLWQRRFDALYSFFYLGMIFVWPYPGEMWRLLVVLLPVLLGQAALLLYRMPWRKVERRAIPVAPVVGAALFAAVTIPQLALTLVRFLTPLPAELEPFRRTELWQEPDRVRAEKLVRFAARMTDAIEAVGEVVPEGECVLSMKPSIVGLLARRKSVYSPVAPDDEAFWSALERAGCRYLLLLGIDTQSAPRFYPNQRMGTTLEPLQVTRIDGNPGSPVVAILALWDGKRPKEPAVDRPAGSGEVDGQAVSRKPI